LLNILCKISIYHSKNTKIINKTFNIIDKPNKWMYNKNAKRKKKKALLPEL